MGNGGKWREMEENRTMCTKENARDKLYKQIRILLKIFLLGKSTMTFAYFSCVPIKQT